MLATLSFSLVTARSSSPSERFTSCSGSTKLPAKRSGYCACHCAALSLQRMHRSRSVCGSAQDVPCSTVLEVTTLMSMPRASMSSISSFGSNMRCISCTAPGRGAGIGFAPNPVKTVLLVEALNTPSSSMCTWKSTTRGRSCFTARFLFRLDSDFLHDAAPFRGIGAYRLRHRVGRLGTFGEKAQAAQALHRFRILEDPVHLAVHPQHGLVRRASRRDDEKPADQLEPRERLADGGHFLIAGNALGEARGERAQLAAPDARRGGGNGEDDELGAARERVLDPEGHGRVGHGEDAGSRDLVQPRGHHAGEVSEAVGGPGELAGVRLVVGDQLRERLHRHARMHEDEERTLGDHGHRHEIARRIVGQRLEGVRIGNERRRRGAEEVVAVGGGARRRLPGEDVPRARAVVDDDLLAERARQALSDEAANDVGRRAGWERDDDPNRTRGPALSARFAEGAAQHRERQRASEALHDSHSGCSLMSFTSFAQRTRSSFRKRPSSSGVPGPSLIAPRSSSRFCTSAWASTAFASALTLRTTLSAVPAGATSANQPTYSKPG